MKYILIIIAILLFNSETLNLRRSVRKLDDSLKEIENENGKCDNGQLSDHRIWNKIHSLSLQYNENTKISCLEVVGPTASISGGLQDHKITISCLSSMDCEIKVFTQPAKKCIETNDTEEFAWPDKNSLHVNFTDHIITCMEFTGAFQLISGGINYTHLTVKCLSDSCIAKVYKESIEKCYGVKPIVVQTWYNDNNFVFDNDLFKVMCFEVKGAYETVSGNNHKGKIILKCLSLVCEVTLYTQPDYGEYCIKTDNQITTKWNQSRTYQIDFGREASNEITCFLVNGEYILKSGGIQQNSLFLSCKINDCEVTLYLKWPIFVTRSNTISESISIFNSISNITISISNITESLSTPKILSTIPMHQLFSTELEFDVSTNKISCSDFLLYDKMEWNKSKSLNVKMPYKIECLNGKGDYQIKFGGENFTEVVAECTSNCSLEIYVSPRHIRLAKQYTPTNQFSKCSNFTLFASKEWTYKAPLVFRLKEEIKCYFVEGSYEKQDGGIDRNLLVLECTSEDKCIIHIFTEPKPACKEFKLFLTKEFSSAHPISIYLPNDTKIDCFDVKGNYRVVSGNIGLNKLIIECLTDDCKVDIYVGRRPPKREYTMLSEVNKCEGELAEKNCWDKSKPIKIDLSPSEIFCVNISGEYKIVSGGVGLSTMEVECLGDKCCIEVYVVDFNKFIGGCKYGKFQLHKRWRSQFEMKFEDADQIVCYNTRGRNKLNSGGIGKNYIDLKCEQSECEVEIFTVRANIGKHDIAGTVLQIASLFFILFNRL